MAIFFNPDFTNRLDLGGGAEVFQNQPEGTIMCWVTFTSYNAGEGQNQPFGFSTGTGSSSTRLSIKIEADNVFRWAGRRLDEHGLTTLAGGAVLFGVTQHAALVANWASNTLTAYLDGVQVASGNMANTGNTPGTTSLAANIGSNTDGSGQHIRGSMQDCRAYRRALTPQEISSIHMARGRDKVRNGLYHRWIMFGPGGVTASATPDTSIGGRTATPINFPQYSMDNNLSFHSRAQVQ